MRCVDVFLAADRVDGQKKKPETVSSGSEHLLAYCWSLGLLLVCCWPIVGYSSLKHVSSWSVVNGSAFKDSDPRTQEMRC